MYDFVKVSDKKYSVRLKGRNIGTTTYVEGKWITQIGAYEVTQSSRKGSVENALTQIILMSMQGIKSRS